MKYVILQNNYIWNVWKILIDRWSLLFTLKSKKKKILILVCSNEILRYAQETNIVDFLLFANTGTSKNNHDLILALFFHKKCSSSIPISAQHYLPLNCILLSELCQYRRWNIYNHKTNLFFKTIKLFHY